MRATTKKLLRDLVRTRGQGLTIALVVAAGIASHVSISGTYGSLLAARDRHYERARLADVFAACRRAPRALGTELSAIEGVTRVHLRIVERGLIPMARMPEPATATLVSLPETGAPPLVDVVVTEGRLPDPRREGEALLLAAFAEHHDLHAGDALSVVMNGTLRSLRIAGLAMSPEYVLSAEMGGGRGDDRFAVLWLPEPVLAAAYDLEGAFSSALLATAPGASERAVLAEVDRLLSPFGGTGAVPRRLQLSAYVVDGELAQLAALATTVPAIFLSVAAFLLHVALARLVALQRGQIAILRALGYPGWTVAAHYVAFASVVASLGGLLGLAIGARLGRAWMDLYLAFFHFPGGSFRLTPGLAWAALAVSLGAALLGGCRAAVEVMRLPPAEAMRPASPEVYRSALLSRLGVARLFESAGRMVVREIERRPGRLLVSSFGIAMSVAILVAGRFQGDALDHLVHALFERAMREDLSVAFDRPVPARAARELAHLPGVLSVEGIRQLPARIRAGHRHRDVTLAGHAPDLCLRRILDVDGVLHRPPSEGVALTAQLATILGARRGGRVDVEILTGARQHGSLRVAALPREMFGLQGYLTDRSLRALLREEPSLDLVLMQVDPRQLDELRRRLARYPGVAAVVRRGAIVRAFREQTGSVLATMTLLLTAFAAVIAVGVVYNDVRVALSLRERDLATLRVLGFTRREVGAVLLGEIVAHLVVGIPFGLWAGRQMAAGILATVDPERYRWPLVISDRTYAFAALVVVAATLVTWILVRDRLRRLDLLAVLKVRE